MMNRIVHLITVILLLTSCATIRKVPPIPEKDRTHIDQWSKAADIYIQKITKIAKDKELESITERSMRFDAKEQNAKPISSLELEKCYQALKQYPTPPIELVYLKNAFIDSKTKEGFPHNFGWDWSKTRSSFIKPWHGWFSLVKTMSVSSLKSDRRVAKVALPQLKRFVEQDSTVLGFLISVAALKVMIEHHKLEVSDAIFLELERLEKEGIKVRTSLQPMIKSAEEDLESCKKVPGQTLDYDCPDQDRPFILSGKILAHEVEQTSPLMSDLSKLLSRIPNP